MSGYEPFPVDADSNRVETTVDPRLAGRWRRFFAWLVDLLVLSIIGFAVAIGLALAAPDMDEDALGAILIVVWLALALLYYPLLMRREGRRNGQTLGKQWLKVRVVTREGVPVTFWRGVRRDVLGTSLLNAISSGLYALVDYPVGLFTDRRQTLHDRIAATFVFRADVAVAPVADSSPFGTEQQPRAAAQPTPEPRPQPQREPRPAEQPPSQPWTPPRSPDYDRQRDDVNRAFGR